MQILQYLLRKFRAGVVIVKGEAHEKKNRFNQTATEIAMLCAGGLRHGDGRNDGAFAHSLMVRAKELFIYKEIINIYMSSHY